MSSETIILFDVPPEMERLVRSLIASFYIRIVQSRLDDRDETSRLSDTDGVALCIVAFEEDPRSHIGDLRRLKGHLKKPVPLLVLLPEEWRHRRQVCIDAGADDFCLLPLDEGRFSIRFLVLLECGQAIANAPPPRDSDAEERAPGKGELWQKIKGFLRQELAFFTPFSQAEADGGPILNRWERIRNLGAGGDGTVWQVRDIHTGRDAVAKVPHNRRMNTGVLRAAAILKRLVHHPNVIHLLEVVKEGDKVVLIQEYVPGRSLAEALQAGMTSAQREEAFIQLLSVTAYAHHHLIMHRDIKPDNVMITDTGNVKLLDFGIAEDLAWQDGGSISEGTLDVMPPEQFEGKSCLATDVWALGIILYLLAVNRMPFYHDNRHFPMDIPMEMQAVPPRRVNPDLSPDLERIIMACLAPSLEVRYPSAMALLEDLTGTFPQFGSGHILSV